MAIGIEKVLSNGAVASYWRISAVHVVEKVIKITMEAYTSQAYRDAGLENGLCKKNYVIPVGDIDIQNSLYYEIFEWLHTLPEFEGGVAILED